MTNIERLAYKSGLGARIEANGDYSGDMEKLAKFAALVADDAMRKYERLMAAYRAHNAAGLPVVEIIPASDAPALSHPEDAAK